MISFLLILLLAMPEKSKMKEWIFTKGVVVLALALITYLALIFDQIFNF